MKAGRFNTRIHTSKNPRIRHIRREDRGVAGDTIVHDIPNRKITIYPVGTLPKKPVSKNPNNVKMTDDEYANWLAYWDSK